MKYINAKFLLPDALVKELQHYIQGGYLYIPTDQAAAKMLGRKIRLPAGIAARNCRIRAARRQGASLEHLAEQYCLSIHAIRKIIYQK